ncbi:MAG: twin-arginine translocation signal domain-containing protein, partial [Planctomycetales bacterium]|nr:twin-arginine translocation signal domain-containing protein [Planctomycetales bacterium]
MNSETTRREFLAVTAGAGVGLAMGSHLNFQAILAEEVSKGRLLHRIDCTQNFPPEKYFAHGDVKVVES